MGDKMKINWKKLIIAIAIPLIVGGISALLTKNSMMNFSSLEQPPLSPPPWIFPVAWTILYTLMGTASYIVCELSSSEEEKHSALTYYALQLILNFFWPIVFFNLEFYLFAFLWLLLLIATVIVMAYKFKNISNLAFIMILPYILWLIFAAYLNLGIFILN